MRVLGDLADQRLAVGVGHPVLRLDALLGVDLGLEALFQRRALGGRRVQAIGAQANQDLACTSLGSDGS